MLNGKTALVTGSTSGIGKGIAETLAVQGCNIVLNGFGDANEIEAQRLELAERSGTGVIYEGADLTKAEEIAGMIDSARAHFGAVDILVNNAGIQYTAPIESFPPKRWDSIIAINLSAVFHCTRLALPGMRDRGWGRIVNIASVHGLVASAEKAAYVAAKHAVIGLTKVVALETATSAITCNAICPGWVLTPLFQKQIDARAEQEGQSIEEAKRALVSEKQPSGETAAPGQIGDLVAFLCSESAAQMTGGAYTMDGAWTAQ